MALNRNLKAKLPNNLKGDPFWNDIMDVIEEELGLFKDQIMKKRFYLYPFEYDSIQEMKDIAKSFGFIINTSLGNDLDYVRAYFKAIPFMIFKKGTATPFLFLFKMIEKTGGVYIIPQFDESIYKIIDFETTVSNLSIDKSVIPTIYSLTDFTQAISPLIYFDEGWDFDEDPPVVFDSVNEFPTQNLAIEYDCLDMVEVDGTYYMYTEEYFEYIADGVENFRKVTTVPMIGCQLALFSDLNNRYDSFNKISPVDGNVYTYPQIFCNAAQTKYFRTTIEVDPFVFDDSPDRPFDGVDLWRFDVDESSEGSIKAVESLFDRVYLGIGKKGLQSASFPNIDKNLIIYLPFNQINVEDNTIPDESPSGYTCDLIGDYSFELGYIGKSLVFTGDNYIIANDINFTTTDISINFFVRINSTESEDIQFLFDCNNFIRLYASPNITNQQFELLIDIDGSEISYSPLNLSEFYMISLLYDDSEETLSLYINGVFIFSQFLVYSFSPTTEDAYLGISKFLNANLIGSIEEFRVYSRVLTTNEIGFIYDNKYGTQSSLAYPVYSREIFLKEKYYEMISADVEYYGVVTAVEAQRNYEELGYTNVSSEFTTTYTSTFPNMIPKNIFLHVQTLGSGDVVVYNEVQDDPVTGNFVLDGATLATVDYDTNTITIDVSTLATINPESLVAISYATDYEFEYTEAGVYDDEGKMVAYTTFAPVRFSDMNNHLSLSWIFENNTA